MGEKDSAHSGESSGGRLGDVFRQTRYRIVVILLSMIGQWPYQEWQDRRIYLAVLFFFLITIPAAQIRKAVIERHNLEVLIDAAPTLIFDFIWLAKLLNNYFNYDKMLVMLKTVETDWKITEGEERRILNEYSDKGYLFNKIYIVGMYTAMSLFLCLPFAPNVVVALGLANISAPLKFQFPIDYYIDGEANFFYLQIHIFVGVTLMCTIIVASDVMFIMLAQHVCGLFTAVSYTIEHLVKGDELDIELYPRRETDEKFFVVAGCVRKQNSAIKMAELLDAAHCWSFLAVVGFNMALLTFTGFQLIMGLGDMDQMTQLVVFAVAEVFHLFFDNYLSQRLIDHSLRVYEALNRTKWYSTSIRTRQLLNIMLLRSVIPCTLKAGKIYTMSIENFGNAIRTSVSYFTVLCSFR